MERFWKIFWLPLVSKRISIFHLYHLIYANIFLTCISPFVITLNDFIFNQAKINKWNHKVICHQHSTHSFDLKHFAPLDL